MDLNIKEIGKTINLMGKVYITLTTGIGMRVIFKMEKEQEKVFIIMQVEINMKENIEVIIEMVMGNYN